jgi:response regulator NasT
MNPTYRIAVADDEPDMQDYYRKILPRLGHEVVAVAGSGQDLIDQCRDCLPDLVITDVRMPDIDGFAAALQISSFRPVPVILVSAHHDARLTQRADAGHIMGYLVKPIKQAELAAAIAMALSRFATRDNG